MTGLFIGILVALALIGAPLFAIIGAATLLCFTVLSADLANTNDMLQIVQSMEQLVTKKEFLAIPLFMVSGAIMTAGGIATRLVGVARAGLGWLPGGIAVASVMACMFFAAISGSSPVTLIAVGSIMFPAMIAAGYPENFGIGIVTTAGSLGCLVPPSISMLIYAITVSGSSEAKVDPKDLFLAGMAPAFFIAFLLAAYSVWVGLKLPGAREKFDLRKFGRAAFDGIWALLLPFIVLGGIYGGLYNAFEAGAIASAYALVVTMVIYRELTWRKLYETMVDSAILMGSLILIIVLAFGLNKYLATIKVEEQLMAAIQAMDLGPIGFLLLVNASLIVIGALMDSISCTLIFAPMLAPIAAKLYGLDPLHFGVIFVVNMEIGYLMPPVATNLFVAAAVFKKPFMQVTRAVLPTLGITCFALAVIMYVPTISTGLVNWRDGRAIYQSFPWDGKPVAATAGAAGGAVAQKSKRIDLGALRAVEPDAGAGPTGTSWTCTGEPGGGAAEKTARVCSRTFEGAKAFGKAAVCGAAPATVCIDSLICEEVDEDPPPPPCQEPATGGP